MKQIQKTRIELILLTVLVLVGLPVGIVSWVNHNKTVNAPIVEDGALGVRLPTIVASFTDSIATRMTDSATSFTLVRGTDDQGRSLNGYYSFLIDSEYITANCVATACTVVARGIDVQDGETEVTALKAEHRRGATVTITDYTSLALLTRILNGQESASSTFKFGDGSTTTTLYKTIYADNGATNLPFVRYNEVTGKWQFSDDGTNTVNFATGTSSGLAASTTAGIFITDSEIGVYASSTGSLAFDTLGRLFVSPSFYLPSIFYGPATATNSFRVQTPTSTMDATNKNYVDSTLSAYTATGTLGMAVSYGQALYMSTTGTMFLADADESTTTFRYVGVALEAGSVSSTIKYARAGAIVHGLSGLTAGNDYYLSGTAGGFSTTAGTISAKVLFAITTSTALLYRPTMVQRTTGNIDSYAMDGRASSFVNLGYIPTKVYFTCGGSAGNTNIGSTGQWMANSAGGAAQAAFGSQNNAAIATLPIYYDRVCNWLEGGTLFDIKMTTSVGGFYVSSSNNNSNSRVIRYQAEYIPE